MRQLVRLDDRIGMRLIPNVQARERQNETPYLARVNSWGFRTHEFEPQRPPGKRRVLFYGDSFTEAVGVSDGRRFSDVVEEILPNVEALNFGIRATGTDQQLLVFRERPPELEYDLVVIGLYVGDVHRNGSRYGPLTTSEGHPYPKPYFTLEGDELVLCNVPVPVEAVDVRELDPDERKYLYRGGLAAHLRRGVQRYAPTAKSTIQRIIRHQPAKFLKSADHPAWLVTRAILRQWVLEASSPVLVLAIPPYQYFEKTASSTAYRARFRELGAEPGIVVHDVLDDLIRVARDQGAGTLRVPGDSHFSVAGHRVVGESLAGAIAPILTPAGRRDGAIPR